MVRSGQNSNSFKILCMSSLPANIKRIGSKATEKRWRHHFPHYKSMAKVKSHFKKHINGPWKPEARDQTRLSFYACPGHSWLPATLMMIRSKMNELAWRQHFPIVSPFFQSGAIISMQTTFACSVKCFSKLVM